MNPTPETGNVIDTHDEPTAAPATSIGSALASANDSVAREQVDARTRYFQLINADASGTGNAADGLELLDVMRVLGISREQATAHVAAVAEVIGIESKLPSEQDIADANTVANAVTERVNELRKQLKDAEVEQWQTGQKVVTLVRDRHEGRQHMRELREKYPLVFES